MELVYCEMFWKIWKGDELDQGNYAICVLWNVLMCSKRYGEVMSLNIDLSCKNRNWYGPLKSELKSEPQK